MVPPPSTPFSWGLLTQVWDVHWGWLAACLVLALGYVGLLRRARLRDAHVPVVRVVAFLLGDALLLGTVSSAVGRYAMSLFWVHMVLHLMLIMVVPALLVLGHPLSLATAALGPGVERVLRSWPVAALTHPAVGLVAYTAVIFGTHLSGFMNSMAMSPSLMTLEQVLYVVAGYLMLLPLLGEEPIRWHPPYLLRIVLLLAAMVPDTLVGIVLMQTESNPFPMMFSMHPAWAPPALSDLHEAGAIMWAGGDGLMMLFAVGVVVAILASERIRGQLLGTWLEGVRRSQLVGATERAGTPAGRADTSSPGTVDDDEEMLDAYNRMLARLSEQDR